MKLSIQANTDDQSVFGMKMYRNSITGGTMAYITTIAEVLSAGNNRKDGQRTERRLVGL